MATVLSPDLAFLPDTVDRPTRRLATAVLLTAIRDSSRDDDEGRDARRWLLQDSPELLFWVTAAGFSPERTLPRLRHLVRKGVSRRRVDRSEIIEALRADPCLPTRLVVERFGISRQLVPRLREQATGRRRSVLPADSLQQEATVTPAGSIHPNETGSDYVSGSE